MRAVFNNFSEVTHGVRNFHFEGQGQRETHVIARRRMMSLVYPGTSLGDIALKTQKMGDMNGHTVHTPSLVEDTNGMTIRIPHLLRFKGDVAQRCFWFNQKHHATSGVGRRCERYDLSHRPYNHPFGF